MGGRILSYINHRFLIKYIDNRYWKMVEDSDGRVIELFRETEFDKLPGYYYDIDLVKEQSENPSFYDYLLHTLSRYAYRISDCIVGPDYQWVILSEKEVFRYSNPVIEDPWDAVKPRPSLLRYIAMRSDQNTDFLEKGILIKYNWSSYYHFFINTLAQISLCDKIGLPADIPLVVPYNMPQLHYVEEYFSRMPLKRRVVVQGKDRYLRVGELFVVKDLFCNDNYPNLHREFTPLILAEDPPVESPELIFVKRGKDVARAISNSDEIEAIVLQHGFTVVEPGDYDLPSQVKLFSGARVIIGTHGAGLTNIVFCTNSDLRLLEIMPGNGLEPKHFEYISMNLGYHYEAVHGDGLCADSTFHLDVEMFEKKVRSFMSYQPA